MADVGEVVSDQRATQSTDLGDEAGKVFTGVDCDGWQGQRFLSISHLQEYGDDILTVECAPLSNSRRKLRFRYVSELETLSIRSESTRTKVETHERQSGPAYQPL